MSDPVNDQIYPAGAFFLTRIGGRTGAWVSLGQALTGRPSRWTHAGIIEWDGRTLEAAPGGVRFGRQIDLVKQPHLISDAPIRKTEAEAVVIALVGARERYQEQLRQKVIGAARGLVGTPYSFLDYVALALLHLEELIHGGSTWRLTRWVRERVRQSEHYICSAFVDEVYRRAGISLFNDGRYPGDVMPSDLDWWAHDNRQFET